MGTTAHIIVVSQDSAERHCEKARTIIERCEEQWSRFRPHSEVSKINQAAPNLVTTNLETIKLLSLSVDAWVLSEGIYNPSILNSMKQAGYNNSFEDLNPVINQEEHLPGNPKLIEVFSEILAVKIPEGSQIDLGGIAKGYTSDLIADELIADGVEGCLINIGGDLAARGNCLDRAGWKINLECLGSEENVTISIKTGAVCTSSILKRNWVVNGQVEHHLRHPITGQKIETDISTVSIICENARQGEILAKIFLFKGTAQIDQLCAKYGVTGVAVDSWGNIIFMEGLEHYKVN